jgi:hypothetical protein
MNRIDTVAQRVVFTTSKVVGGMIWGTPGSLDATIKIASSPLPPQPLPFGGVIKESALNSTLGEPAGLGRHNLLIFRTAVRFSKVLPERILKILHPCNLCQLSTRAV